MFDLELCTQPLGEKENGLLRMLSSFSNFTSVMNLDFLKIEDDTHS